MIQMTLKWLLTFFEKSQNLLSANPLGFFSPRPPVCDTLKLHQFAQHAPSEIIKKKISLLVQALKSLLRKIRLVVQQLVWYGL